MVRIGEIAQKMVSTFTTNTNETVSQSYEKMTKGLAGDNSYGSEGLEIQHCSAQTEAAQAPEAKDKGKTDYVYDKYGNLSAAVTRDEQGRVTKKTIYNDEGKVFTQEYEYDSNGNVSHYKFTNSNGMTTEASYKRDKSGRIVEEKYSSSDGSKGVSTYKYDENGRVVQKTTRGNDKNGNAINTSKKYEYDINGNVRTITDENGNKEIYNYNKNGEVSTITVLDKNGEIISENKIDNPEEQMMVNPKIDIDPLEPDPNK